MSMRKPFEALTADIALPSAYQEGSEHTEYVELSLANSAIAQDKQTFEIEVREYEQKLQNWQEAGDRMNAQIEALRAELELAKVAVVAATGGLNKRNAQLAESESERLEQARLLGMSGERELALLGRLAEAEGIIDRNNSTLELARGSLGSDQSVAFEVVDDTLALNETYFTKVKKVSEEKE